MIRQFQTCAASYTKLWLMLLMATLPPLVVRTGGWMLRMVMLPT
jgi:hypothetical protein